MSDWFLSVAIPKPVRGADRGLFSYRVSEEVAKQIEFGSVVHVPFGRSRTHAFVVQSPKPAIEWKGDFKFDQLKQVESVDLEPPSLTKEIYQLCEWTANYYQSPLGEVVACALPRAALGLTTKKRKPRVSEAALKIGNEAKRVQLNAEQTFAIETFCSELELKKTPALLEGVTGSGKTEVYLSISEAVLQRGQGVLILVPEIALTPQIVERFEERFPGKVAMWHSALAAGERRDLMSEILTGRWTVVIGARSSIFAPVKNLGLIIVDEEHDASYKQEDRVRYNARDLAFVRAHQQKIGLLLGSATPSLETVQKAHDGKLIHLKLTRQATEVTKSNIEIISLLEEVRVPEIQTPLAQRTVDTIRETLARGNQVMVLLNRKGFANFLLCTECRWVAECDHCSLSMTVHRRGALLRCHTCGDERGSPNQCPKCLGSALEPIGCGTERLEEELSALFPEVRSLRLDRDKITSQTRLEKLLTDFRERRAQILFGTQMLAKGHDFPGVQLVVVILADGFFRFPDFRSTERAVQALLQVSGRAGRHLENGQVLIQTLDPAHPVLAVVQSKLSYEDWRQEELGHRQAAQYPPYVRLCKIRIEDVDSEVCKKNSEILANELRQKFSEISVLGPSEAFIARVKGYYRTDFLIKATQTSLMLAAAHFCRDFVSRKKWQCIVDVDPFSLN